MNSTRIFFPVNFLKQLRNQAWLFLAICLAMGCTMTSAIAAEKNKYGDLFISHIEKSGAIGGTLYILKNGDTDQPEVISAAAAGLANLKTNRAAQPTDLIRYASITKTYIAMLVTKAHVEGKIQLDAPLTANFPDSNKAYLPEKTLKLIPNADKATWRTLLNHGCSIYDYRDQEFTAQLIANPFTPMREIEVLESGLKRGLENGLSVDECKLFYSNSNYVVMGILLDRLYGKHHSNELYRLLKEMQLTNTYYEKHYQIEHYPDLEHLSHSYVMLPGQSEILDATWADDGYGFANGGLIGTPADLARFYSLLFSDRIAAPMASLDEKQQFLKEMTTPNEAGLALGNIVRDGYNLHGGSIGGTSSIALYSSELRTTIVFYINDGSRFPSMRFDFTDMIKSKLSE